MRYNDETPYTLDAALGEIARRSFYETATIAPIPGTALFTVNDDNSGNGENIVDWTYRDGLDLSTVRETVDHSGLMEPDQFFDNAAQIRHYLPKAVAALESGHAVTFEYLIAEDSETIDNDPERYELDGPEIVGWLLAAYDNCDEWERELASR